MWWPDVITKLIDVSENSLKRKNWQNWSWLCLRMKTLLAGAFGEAQVLAF